MDTAANLAARILTERSRRHWSLADLARMSGVSKGMLSKIERQEVSPTATVLVRIAAAFDQTLAGILTPENMPPARWLKACDQPLWQDPDTGYLRRQVFQSAASPLELVEVELPAQARVEFPAGTYHSIRQVVWLLEGRLNVRQGEATVTLAAGDRLEFGPPEDSQFQNPSDRPCRYLVALIRVSTSLAHA